MHLITKCTEPVIKFTVMIPPVHAKDGEILQLSSKDDNSVTHVHVRICLTQPLVVLQRKLLMEYKQKLTMSS